MIIFNNFFIELYLNIKLIILRKKIKLKNKSKMVVYISILFIILK